MFKHIPVAGLRADLWEMLGQAAFLTLAFSRVFSALAVEKGQVWSRWTVCETVILKLV